jgi:hypothetical protein
MTPEIWRAAAVLKTGLRPSSGRSGSGRQCHSSPIFLKDIPDEATSCGEIDAVDVCGATIEKWS